MPVTRSAVLLALGAAALAVLTHAGDADAGRRRRPRKPRTAIVSQIETPLGLQGVGETGPNVVVPFILVDTRRHAPTEVDVQFGVDLNGDGSIEDHEYRPATEDRLDPRGTRAKRRPRLFATHDHGAWNAFVWDCTADLGDRSVYSTQGLQHTPQGRLIPDPEHPGEFLFDDEMDGVRVRIRAVRGRGRQRDVSAWAYTDAFTVINDTPPGVTIDSIAPVADVTGPGGRIEIRWTAFDRDSEDENGDGVFEPGEDLNGNRWFDQEQVGVAFDFHSLLPGEEVLPAFMLDGLTWEPCTRALGAGDTDSFREIDPTLAIYGAPGGRHWTFVWDRDADMGENGAPIILRARAIDQKRQLGEYVYVRLPVVMDD